MPTLGTAVRMMTSSSALRGDVGGARSQGGARCQQWEAWAAGEVNAPPELCSAVIDDGLRRGSPGDCTCDSSCTSAKGLHHIQSTPRASVGALPRNRQVVYVGGAHTPGRRAAESLGGDNTRVEGQAPVWGL